MQKTKCSLKGAERLSPLNTKPSSKWLTEARAVIFQSGWWSVSIPLLGGKDTFSCLLSPRQPALLNILSFVSLAIKSVEHRSVTMARYTVLFCVTSLIPLGETEWSVLLDRALLNDKWGVSGAWCDDGRSCFVGGDSKQVRWTSLSEVSPSNFWLWWLVL